MSRELALANKIMKEANDFTGWGVSIRFQGEGYLVGTSLSQKDGQVMNIVFEIQKSEVVINTILPELRFDKEIVKLELEKLSFLVEAMGSSGKLLMAKCHIPFVYAKRDTCIIVRDMMAPMVAAMSEIVIAKIA